MNLLMSVFSTLSVAATPHVAPSEVQLMAVCDAVDSTRAPNLPRDRVEIEFETSPTPKVILIMQGKPVELLGDDNGSTGTTTVDWNTCEKSKVDTSKSYQFRYTCGDEASGSLIVDRIAKRGTFVSVRNTHTTEIIRSFEFDNCR